MYQMVLLFVRQILGEIFSNPESNNEAILKADIMTPLGKLDGIRQSQLELLQIPYISEIGEVGRLPMRRLYLEQVINNLAAELHVDLHTLFDGSREFVIVAEINTSTGGDFYPCYYGTTRNAVNMENFRLLEANVMRCLGEGLDILPPAILNKWIDSVLIPVFEQAKTVISDTKTEKS